MATHGPLSIEIFQDGMFQENGYLAWRPGSPEAWIVDPGFPPQPDQIAAALAAHALTRAAIVITHAHVDHIAGIQPLRAALPHLPLLVPRAELALLRDARENLSATLGWQVVAPEPDRELAPGDELTLGSLRWRAIDVAGHSPGGLAYYCAEVAVAFVGDAVFAEGIGRTDFPHSDHDRLIRNLRQNVLTLPEETVLYPGHGSPARVRDVRERNETLRAALREAR
jgi:hydroxyacylglutathione hydrolase